DRRPVHQVRRRQDRQRLRVHGARRAAGGAGRVRGPTGRVRARVQADRVTRADRAMRLPAFLSFRGRAGRAGFAIQGYGTILAAAVLMCTVHGWLWLVSALICVTVGNWLLLSAACRRLHDLGSSMMGPRKPGDPAFGYALVFRKGDAGPNQYG